MKQRSIEKEFHMQFDEPNLDRSRALFWSPEKF